MHKVATTLQLGTLIARALKYGYNRAIESPVLSKLDPKGKHVVRSIMIESDGLLVRCHVLMKLKGRNTPETASLDVCLSDFNALPDAPEA